MPKIKHMGEPFWCDLAGGRFVLFSGFGRHTGDKDKVTCAKCQEVIRSIESPHTEHRRMPRSGKRITSCGLEGERLFATRERETTCVICSARHKHGQFLIFLVVISILIGLILR